MDNRITYWRFREGLCALFEKSMASEEEKDELIRKIEQEYWFCGGKDTRPHKDINDDRGQKGGISQHILDGWARLWRQNFPDDEMPEATTECVCDQEGLRYNCYLTNGKDILIIGRICLHQFLPKQAKNIYKKRCDRCVKPHRNRNDNHCKECRVAIKMEQKRQAKEEYDKRLLEQQEHLARERMERERREVEEAERRARTCECGRQKEPQYPTCYPCMKRKREEQMMTMTPQQRRTMVCGCGRTKKPQYLTCWACRPSKKDEFMDWLEEEIERQVGKGD